MKRCLASMLCILMLLSLISCAKTDIPETTAQEPKATESPEEAKVLKVFTIGNSHSLDATQLLYEVFKAQNPEQEVVIGTMYYSGCSIAQHVSFATKDEQVYTYNVNSNGTWERIENVSLKMGIKAQAWDIVVIQEAGDGNESNFKNSNRQILVDYVNDHLSHPHEFVWNMDIVSPNDEIFYSPDYDPQPPSGWKDKMQQRYNNDPATALRMAQQNMIKYILPDSTYTNYIPTGTAILYAHFVDNWKQVDLYRDYTHTSDYGRLIASYMWYAQLTGEPLTEVNVDTIEASLRHRRAIKLGDMEVTPEMKQTIINAVNYSLEHPWEVPGEN